MFDFYFYYAASIALLQGHNPYDVQNLSKLFNQINAPHTLNQITLGFAYPPHTLWLFIFLSFLDLKYSMFVWVVFSICAILASVKLFQVTINKCVKTNEKYFGLVGLSFLFFPLLRELSLGQVVIVPLLGICLFYYLISINQKDYGAGFALSLVLIKPHIILIWLLSVILFSIKSNRFKIILGLVIGFLIQFLISYLIHPDGWINYLNHQSHFNSQSQALPHSTLHRLFEVSTGIKFGWIWVTSIFGVIFTLIDSLKYKWSLEKSILIHLPLSLVLAPFGWLHDQTILLPTFLLIIILIFKDKLKSYRTIASISMLCVCTIIYKPKFEFLMWGLPFVILILGLLCLKKIKVEHSAFISNT
jgi:hypothetical protein